MTDFFAGCLVGLLVGGTVGFTMTVVMVGFGRATRETPLPRSTPPRITPTQEKDTP